MIVQVLQSGNPPQNAMISIQNVFCNIRTSPVQNLCFVLVWFNDLMHVITQYHIKLGKEHTTYFDLSMITSLISSGGSDRQEVITAPHSLDTDTYCFVVACICCVIVSCIQFYNMHGGANANNHVKNKDETNRLSAPSECEAHTCLSIVRFVGNAIGIV